MGWIPVFGTALVGVFLGVLEIVKGPDYDRRHGYGALRFVETRTLGIYLVCGSVMTAIFAVIPLLEGR
ncbi:MAG: hypothetical protein WB297_11960 [Actinomycetota bacterium]